MTVRDLIRILIALVGLWLAVQAAIGALSVLGALATGVGPARLQTSITGSVAQAVMAGVLLLPRPRDLLASAIPGPDAPIDADPRRLAILVNLAAGLLLVVLAVTQLGSIVFGLIAAAATMPPGRLDGAWVSIAVVAGKLLELAVGAYLIRRPILPPGLR